MGRMRNQLRYFLRYYGASRGVSFLLPKLFPGLRRSQRLINWKESAFDQKFGVNTVGCVKVDDLDIGPEARTQAVEYCPTSGIMLGIILEELGIDHSQFSFVDFGCGKGRVLCLAAEFPFKEIIGVELSRGLCDAADQNTTQMFEQRKKCRNIRVENVDAILFEFPPTPLFLYFFNPFGKDVMQEVLSRVVLSWQSANREVLIVYSNPVHRGLLDESDSWKEHVLQHGSLNDQWVIYRLMES